MRHVPLALILALVASLPTTAAPAAAPAVASEARPFGWLADLAGACWRATFPDGSRTDTQCYTMQYGKFLRGSIRLEAVGKAADGKPPFEGDSIFVWDAPRNRMAMSFWSSSGQFGQSWGLVEGEAVRFPDPPKTDPKQPDLRSTWRRLDADRFEVVRERKDGETWTRVAAFTYARVRP